MQEFLQQMINGLSVGAVYALIAVGYTMVYGVLRLINFAHGDVFMVGAFAGLFAVTKWFGLVQAPWWMALPLVLITAMLICGVLGFVIERFAYRPLRDQPRLTVLITAIGVSMLLEFGAQHPQVFGATPRPFPELLPATAAAAADGIVISTVDIVIFVLTITLMLGLSYLVKFTRTGMALRAVSHRFDTAMLMGINTDRIISYTFILGSALAAVAGVLWGIKYRQIDPLMGLIPGLKAFIAAVLGGIGNIAGAVVGAFVLGLTEVMVVAYLPGGSQYRDGVAFVILIVILLVKPSGLFGKHVAEKV
ncbi:MAG TPA: branched-chain amino acid ABC transporter permease [Tepidisphaeraceae bacterium]|nr:branched-chain amino acid ABC transporter permease [Tepidisphaeraceae bacterium]